MALRSRRIWAAVCWLLAMAGCATSWLAMGVCAPVVIMAVVWPVPAAVMGHFLSTDGREADALWMLSVLAILMVIGWQAVISASMAIG